jgi:hypothetical protein
MLTADSFSAVYQPTPLSSSPPPLALFSHHNIIAFWETVLVMGHVCAMTVYRACTMSVRMSKGHVTDRAQSVFYSILLYSMGFRDLG